MPARAPNLPIPRETIVQRAIIAMLRMYRFVVVVHRQGALRTERKSGARGFAPLGAETYFPDEPDKQRGYPDLEVLVGNGHVVWIECKRPGCVSNTSDAQRNWHRQVRSLGYQVLVSDNVQESLSFCLAARSRAMKEAA